MPQRTNKRRQAIPEVQTRDEGVLTTEIALPEWKLVLLHAAIIIAAGLWIYWPAIHGGWIGDDSLYLSENPLLHDPARLWKAWFQPGSFIEYYPLEETVQWVQWQLWGNDTLGYHLTNVGLHVLSALLVWRLLRKFGLQLAWLGGIIFAIHPMMVESVAGISELKNTLSLPPFLLAMGAWIDYAERGRPRDYLLALGLFLVAMLCKISMAPFPVVILLYAWWRRGRIGSRDFLACVPFLVISVILVLLNVWSSSEYARAQMNNPYSVGVSGFLSRFVLAGQTISFYFAKCFWPVGPMVYYPKWKVDPSSPVQFLPWLIMAGVAGYLWWRHQSWGRHVLLGLGFFIINLGPFLGFVTISYMSYTWVMDHLLYVPIIGLIGIVVAGIEDLDARLTTVIHPLSSGILTVILGLMALESHWYSAAFTSDETFWTYVVDRNPGAWSAQDNLGKVLVRAGEAEKAKEYFFTAIRLKPDISEPFGDLASAYMEMGQVPEAIESLRQGLKRDPDDPILHNNLGILLDEAGRMSDALGEFKVALRRRPLYLDAHNNLGHALLQLGRTPEAIEQFQAALMIDPSNITALDDLGVALGQSGRTKEAMDQFQKSLQIDPNDDTARENLSRLQQPEMPKNAPGSNGSL